MIKSIRLKNWKSYEDSILYVDPLTIIIGTNSSGKSNVVDALIFLSRIVSGIGIYPAINGDTAVKPIRGGLDWVCRQGQKSVTIEVLCELKNVEYKYCISVIIEQTKALIQEEQLIRKGDKEVRLFYTSLRESERLDISAYFWTGKQGRGESITLPRNKSILYQSMSLKLKKAEIAGCCTDIAGLLAGIFVLDPIPNHMRDYSQLSDELYSDGSNIAGVLAALSENKRQETEQILTDYLKKLHEKDIRSVSVECVGKFKKDAMLYCEEAWHNDEACVVDAKGMSDGTLRFLAILVAMLTAEQKKIIVIEEVDNGLHPSRAKILLSMLKDLGRARNIDVIITTHNPALLDAAGSAMIPFITVAHRGENGQSELVLLEEISELPKLISMGSIGDLATTGKIELTLARGEVAQ